MKLKKNAKMMLAVALVALVIGLIIWVVMFFQNPRSNVSEVKVVSEIKEYGYKLRDNKSSFYKNLFQELKKVLEKEEVNEEEYVSLIAEMFLADFYTLKDKEAKTDVGGTDFVHKAAQEDFLEKAIDTVYKYVESNIYGDRKQELPVVKNVTIDSVKVTSFTYEKTTDKKAYTVKANLTYEKDLGYPKEATLTFIHDDKILSLVEME